MFSEFSQLSGNTPFLLAFVPLFLIVYFLPGLLAYILRRKSKRRILIANVPAGLSFFAWFAVLMWAINGKQDEE